MNSHSETGSTSNSDNPHINHTISEQPNEEEVKMHPKHFGGEVESDDTSSESSTDFASTETEL